MRTRLMLGAGFIAATLLAVATIASAQVYPPPTPTATPTSSPSGSPEATPRKTPKTDHTPKPDKTPKATKSPKPTPTANPAVSDSCLVAKGEVGDSFVTAKSDYRSRLEISGTKGCASPQGVVDVTVHSDPVELTSFRAFEDGSFDHVYCLPGTVLPGNHDVVVQVSGRGTLTRHLDVGTTDAAECGTRVLGTTVNNTGSGRSGLLPRTGTELLLWILWALLLLALGTTLMLGSWQYGRRFAVVRSFVDRVGVRRQGVQLRDEEMHVPVIDTTRFVPYRSRVEQTPTVDKLTWPVDPNAPTVTEWDIAQQRNDPTS